MMRKFALVLAFVMVCSSLLWGQQGQVTHKVSGKTTVPYVMIQVCRDSATIVTTVASDYAGSFQVSLPENVLYVFKFHAMGYESDSLRIEVKNEDINIGEIVMKEGQLLDEAVVSSRLMVMRNESDRLVYDVTKDPEAKNSKMMNIMQKIPFMKINPATGKLSYLNGLIGQILINGRPSEVINTRREFPMRFI